MCSVCISGMGKHPGGREVSSKVGSRLVSGAGGLDEFSEWVFERWDGLTRARTS